MYIYIYIYILCEAVTDLQGFFKMFQLQMHSVLLPDP